MAEVTFGSGGTNFGWITNEVLVAATVTNNGFTGEMVFYRDDTMEEEKPNPPPDHHNYFLSSPSRVELLVVVIGVMVWRSFRSNELPKT